MLRRSAFATVVLVALVGCVEEPAEPETAEPTPAVTVTDESPAAHVEDEPHGLGVTRSMVADRLEAMGFALEHKLNPVLSRPAVHGRASLGPSFDVVAIGNSPGVVEFDLETSWSVDSEPPMDAILSLVDFVTPHWEGASEWVKKQMDIVVGHEFATRTIHAGNYAVRVTGMLVGYKDLKPLVSVSVSPRFASCADALAAQDWTMEGSVGSERGYPAWRVPGEVDEDGDGAVCEAIPTVP